MNTVCLTGRALQDPIRKETSRGVVAEFRIAVDGRKRVLVHVETWGQTAGVAVAHLCAGRHIGVTGRLAQRDYHDRETGQKRTWNYVVADAIHYLDRKPTDDRDGRLAGTDADDLTAPATTP